MNSLRRSETELFPRYGARARSWIRFERDLRAWLGTPEGRFAIWRAARGDGAAAPNAAPERRMGS